MRIVVYNVYQYFRKVSAFSRILTRAYVCKIPLLARRTRPKGRTAGSATIWFKNYLAKESRSTLKHRLRGDRHI